MSAKSRSLDLDDLNQVENLCASIWNGNDYVPDRFPKWVADPNSFITGVFIDEKLVGLGTLEVIPGTDIGWIMGVRVREAQRRKGYGFIIVTHLIRIAKEKNVKHLRYATSNQNKASIALAEKAAFSEKERVGYFRLYRPYPAHPKPSSQMIPLVVAPERLYRILMESPDLVGMDNLPLMWKFDLKSLDGLSRMGNETQFRVVINERGVAKGLFYRRDVRKLELKTATFSIFASDRAVFVDIMARILDELDATEFDRSVFFLGPNATEWSKTLGIVSEEYEGRRFLLFELNPQSLISSID